jgi:uncharacterized protein (TIGR03435 family)
MIRIKLLGGVFCFALLAWSPSPSFAAPPAFLAADVHSSPARLHPQIHGHFVQDRAVLRDATLTDLIAAAYKVEPTDILDSPTWLDFDRFDIIAKAPAGTRFTEDENDVVAMAMLRSLLAERFGLVVKADTRPLPAFVLTAGKANKLKPSVDTEQNCQFHQGSSAGATAALIKLTCRAITMDDLADLLHNVGTPYFNRPVINQTKLKGKWDIELQWSYNKPTNGDGLSLPDAINKQLGLKIESKPVPTPVILVKAVNQTPTPNVAGLDKILPPPPPAQFDVAVIHVANPTEKNYDEEIDGNRVTVTFATLQTLIYKSYDTPPGAIEDKPKWLDDVHYDIVGTVAADSNTPLKPGEQSIDEEDVKEMVRSLLADRFKLVTHVGSRPAAVFALVADNPKMTKASDSEHPGCAEGPGPDGKDARVNNPLRNRLISCQNMTMAQFALELHRLASGFLAAPVIDSTGLAGGYDFSISFSKKNLLKAASAAPASMLSGGGPGSEATDPGSGGLPPISLSDALKSQLGVKLEKRDNVTAPTLVIDHVDEKPSDN